MLKQTAESRDRGIQLELGGQKDYVELGSPKDVIFDHDDKLELAWTLCWDGGQWPVEAPTEDFRKALKHDSICFTTVQSLAGKSIVCQSMSYTVGNFRFGLESSAQEGQYDLISEGYELLRPQSRPRHIGAPVKSYAFPDSARLSYTNADFLQGFDLRPALGQPFPQLGNHAAFKLFAFHQKCAKVNQCLSHSEKFPSPNLTACRPKHTRNSEARCSRSSEYSDEAG